MQLSVSGGAVKKTSKKLVENAIYFMSGDEHDAFHFVILCC